MAKLFVTSINLNKNELQNARIQNLSANPSNGVAGQIYFNNVANELRTFDGTQWVSGSSVEFGNTSARPAASKAGQLYVDTEALVLYVDNGTSWVQGTISPEDVAGWISDHSDLTTGVHGVSGNVVGTSDTQTLSNKTISGNLHFNTTENAGSIYADGSTLTIDANANNLELDAVNHITLTTGNGDIILNPDGSAYIGNSGSANNRIATIGDLESNAVVQSVSGTNHEISVSDDGSGNVTVGIADNVSIPSSLTVGEDWNAETNSNGLLQVKKSNGSDAFKVDSANNITVVNTELEIQDGSGNPLLNIYESGVGTARIVATDDISIRSSAGDIILYPGNDDGGTGKAYVHWGNDATGANPGNEITTAANTQVFTNKTVNDELGFTNPSTYVTDGGIVVNDSNENFEIKSYTADLNLYAYNGDINFAPNGTVNVDSNLDVNGQVITPTVLGTTFDGADGSLTLKDGGDTSAIHINGTTKNIELLPNTGSKAFYGSAATAGNEIARVADLQALSSGLNWKQAVNLLSASNIDISQDFTGVSIDGHDPLQLSDVGYRILLKNQSTSSENGIYKLSLNEGSSSSTQLQMDTFIRPNDFGGDILLYGYYGNDLSSGSVITISGTGTNHDLDGSYTITSIVNAFGPGTSVNILNWPFAGYPYGDYECTVSVVSGTSSTLGLERSVDADINDELIGAAVFVMEGTQYGSTSWVQSNHYITGFAGQDWIQFSGQGTYTGSNSIYLDGTSFSVIADTSRGLAVDGDGTFVKLGNALQFDANGDIEVIAGNGFDTSGGTLEFASGYGVRKYSESIGDGSATSWTVSHNLNTRHVTVQIFQATSPYAQVEADVEHTTIGDVTLRFATAPGTGEYEVVVVG